MIFVDLALSFLPICCLLTLIKVRKHDVYSVIVFFVTLALIGFDILVAVTTTDFHNAAFALQLFLPAQLILAVISLLIGNLILLIVNRCTRKKALKEGQMEE